MCLSALQPVHTEAANTMVFSRSNTHHAHRLILAPKHANIYFNSLKIKKKKKKKPSELNHLILQSFNTCEKHSHQ